MPDIARFLMNQRATINSINKSVMNEVLGKYEIELIGRDLDEAPVIYKYINEVSD